jgi:hypothetical protein
MTPFAASTPLKTDSFDRHPHRRLPLAIPTSSAYGDWMTSDSSLVRRVSRLENDTESLYELLDEFRRETVGRFDQVDTKLDAVDRRFDGVETTLAQIARRLPDPS